MPEHTKGPWKWTACDHAWSGDGKCGFKEDAHGPFEALWSVAEDKPVFVCLDASSYSASLDFPNEADAALILAAHELPALRARNAKLEEALDNIAHMDELGGISKGERQGLQKAATYARTILAEETK